MTNQTLPGPLRQLADPRSSLSLSPSTSVPVLDAVMLVHNEEHDGPASLAASAPDTGLLTMPSKNYTRLTGLVLVGLLGVSACGSATTTTASPKPTTSTTAGVPPGAPPGAPPGGSGGAGGSSAQITAKGAYVHSTGTTSGSGTNYDASAANTSGVLNTGGSLTLDKATISTKGHPPHPIRAASMAWMPAS
jgi:hypothetical protein